LPTADVPAKKAPAKRTTKAKKEEKSE
jgi:hypothetical protein